MLRPYNAHLLGQERAEILGILGELDDSDFFSAAAEYLGRAWGDYALIPIPTGPQSTFFKIFHATREYQLTVV